MAESSPGAMISRVARRAEPRGHPGSARPARRVPGIGRRAEIAVRPHGGYPAARGVPYDQHVNWLAARAAAFPPRLQDLALAVVLAAVNVGVALPYRSQLRPSGSYVPALVSGHPLAVALVLLVAQALPLAGRRSWPVTVFLVGGAFRSLYDHWGYGFAPLPLAPAIAYYTVMQRCSTGTRWAISAVLVAGMISSQTVPGHTEPYDFFIQVFIFGAVGVAGILSRSRIAYLADAQQRAARAEDERDRQAALAAAGERARIARELHDVVAHHVSLMAVQAEAASSLLPGQPEGAARSVEIIGETARQALSELRRLLGVLRGPGQQPQAAPSPSLADLDGVLDQVRGAGLTVDLTVQGAPGELAPGVALAAYRVVQEALTNALRHSAAATAAVSIRYEPGYVTVSVADSGPAAAGHGTRPAPAPVARPRSPAITGGFGLAGITERVASCGGTLTVGPTGAGGFAVTARLPAQ
jgi:signal transduction histidine kinase